jgi:threonine dehydratase
MVRLADIQAAAERIAGRVLRTPTLASPALSRHLGADVTLKLDSLQPIGSFKERGAANRIALLTPAERAAGVIAMSAGNHAQAVARHAQLAGIAATIVMPRFTPATKVTRTAAFGARIVMHGDSLSEAGEQARRIAAEEGLVFVHPYDDVGIIAGQGTLALELLADAPELDALVIPLGGGGLLAGCAVAAAALKPGIALYGVEVAAYAAAAQRRAGQPIQVGGPTIAEGIAVRDTGALCWPAIEAHVRDILVVSEAAVEQAIGLLIENAKVVAEGAGAAGIAALLAFPHLFAGQRIGVPICGGNIDPRILANVLLRDLLRDGRLLRLALDISDRPGVLADITTRIAAAGGNIIEVAHQRLFAAPSVQSAELDITIEARDAAHGAAIEQAIGAGGYRVRRP